jgi:phage shock protein A
MGLWARFKRLFRANTGAALDKLENPELILQQTIRDMRDRVPELANKVAHVKAAEKRFAKDKEKLESDVVELDSKIKAAVKQGRDDIAMSYIGQLQNAQSDLAKTGQRLAQATQMTKQAEKALENYNIQLKRRQEEALQLVSESRRAQIQAQLAQTMQSFELGDEASTFNEMREKINNQSALAEAKMELGFNSVDMQMMEIEREAADMQLQDKLLEYKESMGLLGSGSNNAGKQISAGSGAKNEGEV